MQIPPDYTERVYAGVLGKIIGVYLGRPFEGWSYDRIMAELGEINYYVHEKRNSPLILTDDDITGTFTFLRALEDYDFGRALTPAQIGQTWLNYIIERLSILWWGGLGNSTEHTAYLRLKAGIPAPQSGSIALNGKTVAEQIGAQIFIDGWAMVCPGDPELAADLARRAASVSHDGEAIYGAQVLAAMEAHAFVEPDLNKIVDAAVALIPKDSVIYHLISDLREWRARYPDWRTTRQLIVNHYGYDKYGGNCHMVPNHALIHLGLLYGEDDFQKSLMITNTSGWDTDCNSGNIGCLLGIKNGLAGLDAGPDWRGPVADRLYLPTADGGRAITDAVTETYQIANLGRRLAGEPPLAPKHGARYHFELPGSIQGFQAEDSPEARDTVLVENVSGHSHLGQRSLSLRYSHLAPGRFARVATPTFIPPQDLNMPGYNLHACPSLYPGQMVRARLAAGGQNGLPVTVRLYLNIYNANDRLERRYGPETLLYAGEHHEFQWTLGQQGGQPIVGIGLEISANQRADGVVYLDYLTWDGAPDVTFFRPAEGGSLWRRAWVPGVDAFEPWWPEAFRVIQNERRGLLIQGTRQWTDYRVSAQIKPRLMSAGGIGARVQGLQRYYALLFCRERKLRLVKVLDGERTLAEVDFAWELEHSYIMALQVTGNRLQAWIDGQQIFDLQDRDQTLVGGAVALVCEEGCLSTNAVSVKPPLG